MAVRKNELKDQESKTRMNAIWQEKEWGLGGDVSPNMFLSTLYIAIGTTFVPWNVVICQEKYSCAVVLPWHWRAQMRMPTELRRQKHTQAANTDASSVLAELGFVNVDYHKSR